MKKNRIIYIILAVMILCFGLYFLFSTPDGSPKNKSKSDKASNGALALLAGGRSNSDSEIDASTRSLFDNDFWKSGIPKTAVDDETGNADQNSDILEPSDEDNPIDPNTGERYTNEVMKQFDELRVMFPDNSLIPKKLSPDDLTSAAKKRERLQAVQSNMALGTAAKEDLNFYYDYQIKQVDDRLQLLEYVLKSMGGEIDDDLKETYDKVFEMNKKQRESYEEARKIGLGNLKLK